MYHPASSVPFSPPHKSTSSDKVRASAYSISSQPSISSWSHHVDESRLYASPTPKSPPFPLAFVGETPSYHSSLLSPGSGTTLSTPVLHPLLEYHRSGRVHYDVAQHPSFIRFRHTSQPYHFNEQAFYPPTTRVLIRVPGHPAWSFNVESSHGVTLQDVFSAIHNNLHQPMGKGEYIKLPAQVQTNAAASLHGRTSNRTELAQGLKRFDCLSPNRFFIGLTLSTDGSGAWDLNFAPGYQ